MTKPGSRINNEKLKNVVKTIGKIISILSIVFIGVKIYKLGFDTTVIDDIPVFIGISAGAVLLKMLSVVTSASGWGRWISFLSGRKILFRDVFRIYGKAGIGKYLPGNVMHYVGRNVFAAEYGLSQKKIVAGTVMETLELITSAVLMAVLLLPKSFISVICDLVMQRKAVVVAILVFTGIVMLGAMYILIKKWKKIREWFAMYKTGDMIRVFILSLVEYILTLGLLGFVLVILWMYCTGRIPGTDDLKLMISSYSTAWVCGFVIPGASGGIGIREAILTVLLDGIASGPVIMFIIIAHRLMTIIGDFAVYVLVSIRGKVTDVG